MSNLLHNNYLLKSANVYFGITRWMEKYLGGGLLLVIRIWMARIFWYSALTKIDDWTSTLYLFEHVYKVPFIPASWAACLTILFELVCPILLVIGLASRVSTLPLIVMTAVIQFTFLNDVAHLYWALLLMTVLFYGPGLLSLDHLIKQYYQKKNNYL